MSATRLIIRLVLVALLLGIGVVVFRAWLNSKPENIIARAEKSLADGAPDAAHVHLQNLLDRFPDSAEGHRLMAKVILEEARAANQPANYLQNPAAFQQLLEASRLSPNDIELKKEIINIYIAGLKPGDAIEYGQAVLDKEPDNLDALYVVTVPEVQAKSKAAQAHLDKLLAAKEFRRFEVLRLAADYYVRMKKPEELQATLTLAANEAAAIPADKLNALPMLEIDSMTRLFETGVRSAPDATTGLTRLNQALDTFEKFPMSELPVLGQMSQKSSEMMLSLTSKFPSSADSSEAKPLRTQAQDRIDKLRALAVEKKVAGPLVFQQAALAAFNAGDHEKCAELLAQGLVDSDKVPAAQRREVLELHLLAARNALVMRKNAAAQPHLEKLLADKNYSGWGELLSAAVNSSEGRHEKAYQHYQAAQKQLGTILLVDMGLANSCLALGKWQEALPHLQALHKSFDAADIELKSWAALNEISNAGVHFGEFRAYLALNNWEKAKEHLAALAGTPLAMRAQTMAITYLWTKGQREEALARLADARKAAPNEIALLQLQAGFAQQAGKPVDAAKLIEEAAAAQPNDLPRQLLLARWKVQQKDYPAALELIGKLETQFPAEIGPQLLKAQALLQSGDTEKGIEAAKKLKENPATAAAANFLLAAADMRLKDPKSAAAELAEVAEREPNYGLVNLLQGEVAASQGDYASAIDRIGSTLDVIPIRAQARAMLLQSLLQLAAQKGPAEAEVKLAPLLEQNPDDSFLTIAMADLKFKQGQFDVAMKLLDRAEQLDPGRANVPYIKSGIWLQRQRIDSAYHELQRGIGIDGNHLPSRIMAANLALQQGKYKEALEHAQNVLTQSPKYVPMIIAQSAALVGLRRPADAIALLDKAIAEQPQVPQLYDKLLNVQFESQQKDQALATARRGRAKLGDNAMLASDEVVLLCFLDKFEEAQRVATNYTRDKTAKEDFVRYLAMAQAFFRAGKFEAARDWGNQALAIADEPVKPALHMFLGDVNLSAYEMAAVKDKAIATLARDHFTAVLTAQPTNFIAGNNLAWLLANDFDQTAEAAKVIDQVRGKATVEQMPINFIDTVAVVYRKANRLEEAQQVLERANAMYQENPLLLYQLAIVQQERKLFTAARTNLERAIQLGVPAKYKVASEKMLDDLRSQAEATETPTAAPIAPMAENATTPTSKTP